MNVDLEDRANWHHWDGCVDGVFESACRRFSIVTSRKPTRFVSFRKFGSRATGDWSPPVVIGGFATAPEARAACAAYAKSEAT